MAKRLWGIKVMHGSEDGGWLVDRGRIVCVYEDKDFAEKEAKWLNDFKKRCGSKGSYEVRKWVPEEGVETAVQSPDGKESTITKMNERPVRNSQTENAAPAPTIKTNLSELFMESVAAEP